MDSARLAPVSRGFGKDSARERHFTVEPRTTMPGHGPEPSGASRSGGQRLSAEEFAGRFQEAARVLWTIAAGVLGDPSEAEDVLQEAALMALAKLDDFDPNTHFTAWMGRFVRNVALNHARKRARRATAAVAPEQLLGLAGEEAAGRSNGRGEARPARGALEFVDDGHGPVDEVGRVREGQRAFDDRMMAGLNGLEATAREALLLRTVLGLAYREIARILGIPEGTAMSHVHRARKVLRGHLEAEADGAGVTHSTTPGSKP